MSNATCTKCGKEYNWHARRGERLIDNPSPCCNAPGKAVQNGPRVRPPTKYCPECHKAGLLWRSAIGDPAIPNAPDYYHNMYCPRCKKWVVPELKEVTCQSK